MTALQGKVPSCLLGLVSLTKKSTSLVPVVGYGFLIWYCCMSSYIILTYTYFKMEYKINTNKHITSSKSSII